MIAWFTTWWRRIAAVSLLLLGSWGHGYWHGWERGQVRFERLRASEKAERDQADANLTTAKTQLAAALQSLEATDRRAQYAIRKTVGRVCLAPDVLRVLYDLGSPGDRSGETARDPGGPGAVPGDRADRAADAPQPSASDADIIRWQERARRAYEVCRAKLKAGRVYAGEAP